jgi:hypothetical protein
MSLLSIRNLRPSFLFIIIIIIIIWTLNASVFLNLKNLSLGIPFYAWAQMLFFLLMEILLCHRNPTQFYVQRLYWSRPGLSLFFWHVDFLSTWHKTGSPWSLDLRPYKSAKHLIYEPHMLRPLGLDTSKYSVCFVHLQTHTFWRNWHSKNYLSSLTTQHFINTTTTACTLLT